MNLSTTLPTDAAPRRGPRATILAVLCGLMLPAQPARAQERAQEPDAAKIRSRLDLGAVQGLLAVQQLDGWLLYENQGQNPVASALVNPAGTPGRRWFYLIPARGQPTALVHATDRALFEHVPGRKLTYSGHRELHDHLGALLRGARRIAMEYSPGAALPDLSRVDAGTLELVRARARRIKIVSSAELVQVAGAIWGAQGRQSHHVAAHHLTRLREAAVAYLAGQLQRGAPVTELDVQAFLQRGYERRGLVGPPPVVAAGANTASPGYVPSAGSAARIREGDLVLLSMRARLARGARPVFAETTWMAYAGAEVPARHAEVFAVVARARDAAVALLRERAERGRAVRAFEVDRAARGVIQAAGHGARFTHRTGHALDATAASAGASLDDHETHDTRTLIEGAGFTIAPGIYIEGELGVRAAVNVHLMHRAIEVTTPAQTEITAILAR